MSNKEILNIYRPLVHFLSDVLGAETEVVLFDISENQVIEISNGQLSGRKIGSGPTPFLERIKADDDSSKDYMSNYKGAVDGKEFISSTWLIRNEGELIGTLCINRNITAAKALQRDLEKFLAGANMIPAASSEETVEEFDDSITVMVKEKIQAAMDDVGINPQHMTVKEKKRVVMILKRQGVTRMKGAVAEIAVRLDISIPTVYRYMSEMTALFQ